MLSPADSSIGRFAPTPSGALHFGSLLAALASFLDARQRHGHWLVRMEDLDQPRNKPGAQDQILQALTAHGMHWDGPVQIQSQHQKSYQEQINHWIDQGLAYYCDCSRKDLIAYKGVYPGTCRGRHLPPAADHAVRVRVTDEPVVFTDRLQGKISQRLESEIGDFVVRRRDGIIAYQLAVVMDDIAQGVTDIVRGADLLESTPRQLWLYQLLQTPVPAYLHIPLMMTRRGQKLSKRLGSAPIHPQAASSSLFAALNVLNQQPPATLQKATVAELIAWGLEHWQPMQLPPTREILQ
jgi:glutamyl-Q tRNA(Asp) synthetase